MKLHRFLVSFLVMSLLPAVLQAAGSYISKNEYAVLIKNLKSSDLRSVRRAASALQDPGDPCPEVEPALIETLRRAIQHQDLALMEYACIGLSNHGPVPADALSLLLEALKTGRTNRTRLVSYSSLVAIASLDVSNPDRVRCLKEFLRDGDSRLIVETTQVIAMNGKSLESLGPDLLDIALSSDPEESCGATYALGQVGFPDDSAVQVLIHNLARKEYKIRHAAVVILGEIGPTAARAIPDLSKVLKSQYPELVSASAVALGRIGPAASSAVPALTDCLVHTPHNDPEVKRAAVLALARIGGEPGYRSLHDAINSQDKFLSLYSVQALAQAGVSGALVVPDLVRSLKSSDPDMVGSAADALATAGSAAASGLPELGRMLNSDTLAVLHQALLAIESIALTIGKNPPETKEQLASYLKYLHSAEIELKELTSNKANESSASLSALSAVQSATKSLKKEQNSREVRKNISVVATGAFLFALTGWKVPENSEINADVTMSQGSRQSLV